MSDEDVLRSVVAAIADETAVNWTAAELAARDPAERALLNQLKTISTVAASDRPRAHTDDRAVASWPAIGYGAILAFAMLKVALAFVGWSLPPGPIRPVALPASPYIINLSVFSVAAVVLLLGGARDERARRLGAFFLIVAS